MSALAVRIEIVHQSGRTPWRAQRPVEPYVFGALLAAVHGVADDLIEAMMREALEKAGAL